MPAPDVRGYESIELAGGRSRLAGWQSGRAAVRALVQVAGDGAGDLVQVGDLGEQAGQVVQLPGRELVEGMGDVGLGRVAQQDQDQVAVPAVAARPARRGGVGRPGGR